jgi:amino acid transporter
MLLMIPYPAWQTLVVFVTVATLLTYALQPLALGALRLQVPGELRPYRLPFAEILAPASFVLANEIVMAAGWQKVLAVAGGSVVVGYGFLFFAQRRRGSSIAEAGGMSSWNAANAVWLWPYLAGVIVVTMLSSFGFGIVPAGWDLLLMGVLSVGVYWWAIRRRLDDSVAVEYIHADREAALTGEDDPHDC